MKILHYSDKSSPNFLKLYNECDVLICTGDLTLFDFEGLESLQTKKPSFGVYGNHDSGSYLEELDIANLHNKTVNSQGFTWGGFQGCIKYKNSPLLYTEEDARNFSESFPYVDILLLHAGGKDMLDDSTDDIHTGSTNIRNYIISKRPKYVFCGHQYSDAEMTFENTKLFRTYGARIIEI